MNYKKLTLFIIPVIIFSFFSFHQSQNQGGVYWTDIVDLDSVMKKNPKPIYIDVRADWCGMCKKFDNTTLQDDEIIKILNDNFYNVHFDFHDKRSISFNGKMYESAGKYHSLSKYFEATGLPTMIFLDSTFNETLKIQGYYKTHAFKSTLEDVLGKDD